MLASGLALHAPSRRRSGASSPPASATNTVGSGDDALMLKLTQEPYEGSAQYTVAVEGTQIGGTQTAVARRGSGAQDTLTVRGTWAAGTRSFVVTFLNDRYDGTPETDRNLWLEAASFNGTAISVGDGFVDGSLTLSFTKPGAATPGAGKVINAVFRGNDTSDLTAFENWIGKQVEGVLVYTGNDSWNNCDPGWQLGGTTYVGGSGREGLWSIPAWPNDGDPLSRMREAARGDHDSKYTDWAKKILNARSGDSRDIYVRTCWEFGGEWFWWTNNASSDKGAFIDAFRRFSDRFHAVSPRFKMHWDFVPDRPNFGVEGYYPGDAYVDVVSQDVYWHTQYTSSNPDEAFATYNTGHSLGLNYVKNFAASHGKTIAIPEWGVPGGNGNTYNGARFIQLMREWCVANKVLYMTYWDSQSAYDGLLSDGNPSGTADALKSHFNTTLNWT